jgi:hypothetical protein
MNANVETPGKTLRTVNRWGRTESGRRHRITQPRNDPDFVITVVAPDEDT